MAVLACGCPEGSGVPAGEGWADVRSEGPASASPHLEGPVQGTELVGQGCGQRVPALLPSMLCACGVSYRAGHPEGLGFAGPQVLSLLKAHLVSPQAPGRASGSEPWTARGEAGFAEWPSGEWEGGLGPGGEGPTCRPRSQPRLGPHPSHVPPHPHDIFKSVPRPCRGRGSGGKERGQGARGRAPSVWLLATALRRTLSTTLPPVAGAREVRAGLLVPSTSSQVSLQLLCSPLAICRRPAALPPSPLLSSGGPPLSSSSHFPLSFLCASFFCRNLKAPSFITQWTGSRYCAFLTALLGASAQAVGRPLALGKLWDVDPGEAFVPRQLCKGPLPRQDRASQVRGLLPFGERPQVLPFLEAWLYQVHGGHRSLGLLMS